jgi:hypothetical protein
VRRLRRAAPVRQQARSKSTAEAQTRTARLQRRARWALAVIATSIIAGFGVVYWQYLTNIGLQASLKAGQINLLAELATVERLRGSWDGALRLGVLAARRTLPIVMGGPEIRDRGGARQFASSIRRTAVPPGS